MIFKPPVPLKGDLGGTFVLYLVFYVSVVAIFVFIRSFI